MKKIIAILTALLLLLAMAACGKTATVPDKAAETKSEVFTGSTTAGSTDTDSTAASGSEAPASGAPVDAEVPVPFKGHFTQEQYARIMNLSTLCQTNSQYFTELMLQSTLDDTATKILEAIQNDIMTITAVIQDPTSLDGQDKDQWLDDLEASENNVCDMIEQLKAGM